MFGEKHSLSNTTSLPDPNIGLHVFNIKLTVYFTRFISFDQAVEGDICLPLSDLSKK